MTVAFHTSVSALAGYGLARGWGWQFYLLAAFLHSLLNYNTLFAQGGFVTPLVVQVFITLWAVLVTGGVLWLRWSQYGRQTEAEVEIEPALEPDD
jgi:RsiW-degrading membrane proteinase PrsW (M82 family)